MINLVNDGDLAVSLLLAKIRLALSDGQSIEDCGSLLVELNATITPVIAKASQAEGDATLLNMWQMVYNSLPNDCAEGYFESACAKIFSGLWQPPSDEILAFAALLWRVGDTPDAGQISALNALADGFEHAVLSYAAQRTLLTNLSAGMAWRANKDVMRALIDEIQNTPQEVKDAVDGLPLWAVFPRPSGNEVSA